MREFWKRTLSAASLIVLSFTAAQAGGGGSLKDGPYRPSTWTGAYIGIVGGGAWGESRFNDGVSSNPFDIDGYTIGGTIGYNLQVQRGVVVGIEADLSYSSISGSFGPGDLGQPNGSSWFCGSGACVTDVNWFGTVRGRLGIADDRYFVYATGGLAFGDVDSQIRNASDWVTGGTNVGWAAGGGVELVLAPGWTGKVEYLHVDLGWTDRSNTPAQLKADAKFDIIRLGLNYRLGSGF